MVKLHRLKYRLKKQAAYINREWRSYNVVCPQCLASKNNTIKDRLLIPCPRCIDEYALKTLSEGFGSFSPGYTKILCAEVSESIACWFTEEHQIKIVDRYLRVEKYVKTERKARK